MQTIDLKTILDAVPPRAVALLRNRTASVHELVRHLCHCYALLPTSPRSAQFTEADQNRLTREFFNAYCWPDGEVNWHKLINCSAQNRPEPVRCSHSPEPWRLTGSLGLGYTLRATLPDGSDTDGLAEFPAGDSGALNAQRAVACVNALAGVTDPAAELARLRKQEQLASALRTELEDYRSLAEKHGAELAVSERDLAIAEAARFREQCARLVAVVGDCAQSLARLPDVDGAYRVTCLEQAKKVLNEYAK